MVPDSQNVYLDCPDGHRLLNQIAEENEFCPKDLVAAIALPVVLILLLLLTSLIIFLLYREYVYVWIYSKATLRPLFFTAHDRMDKRFDAFISYSHADKEFVEDLLVPQLEENTQEFQYKCLVHVRDFVPGRAIVDQISEAVDCSCCTLIVLSENFVKSDWARHEFDIAYARSKIIVVVKGEMPDRTSLPEGMHDFLRTNTYLSWDDPWFWRKLRFALPHKGASEAGCCIGFDYFRPKTDQMQLLQSGLSSRAMSSLSMPGTPPIPNGRHHPL